MRIINPEPPERMFQIELSETELTDLTCLGYHHALCSHPTYQSLRKIADEAGVPSVRYSMRRDILASRKGK